MATGSDPFPTSPTRRDRQTRLPYDDGLIAWSMNRQPFDELQTADSFTGLPGSTPLAAGPAAQPTSPTILAWDWTAIRRILSRGGDVIRFAELYHQVKFPQALALLRQWRGWVPLLDQAVSFYHMQLHRRVEAVAYLQQRGIRSPELIEHMRIGYTPGGSCLRRWLTQLGYPIPALRQAGLVTAIGYDAYKHRIVFPLEGNLYGRSLSASAPPHRFLPGAKGGLYLWERVRRCPEVILVEGLFDYAVLWQAGFHNVTCSMGNHLNAYQFRQLCDGRRTVYLTFDADSNGSGQQAAQWLACRLREQGLNARRVCLPEGHDPNSFFVQGGDAPQFQCLLEEARA
jgi:DNA primase